MLRAADVLERLSRRSPFLARPACRFRDRFALRQGGVNGGAKLVHPGGAKLVHLMLCGTRCWGVVPVVHRRDPRCFV